MRPLILLLVGCGAPPECEFAADPLGTLTSWEEEIIAGAGLPDAPDPGFLEGEEGLQLAYREWIPTGWDGSGSVAVFIPGSSAHADQYTAIGAGLSERGVLARIIDVRGHGLSACASAYDCSDPAFTPREIQDNSAYFPGRIGDSADDNQILRDVGAHLADLRAAWPDASLHLGGHSSGGGVVSRYLENAGPGDLANVALVAPYNHPDQPQVRKSVQLECTDIVGTDYARVDLGALGDAIRGNDHRYVISFHKGEAYEQPLDTLAYTYTTLQGMSTTDPDAFWSAFTVPLLFVAGSDDHLLDPDESERQFERAPAGGSFFVAEETSHIGLSWSDEVAAELAAWFQ